MCAFASADLSKAVVVDMSFTVAVDAADGLDVADAEFPGALALDIIYSSYWRIYE